VRPSTVSPKVTRRARACLARRQALESTESPDGRYLGLGPITLARWRLSLPKINGQRIAVERTDAVQKNALRTHSHLGAERDARASAATDNPWWPR
jgi:hypothetical protein